MKAMTTGFCFVSGDSKKYFRNKELFSYITKYTTVAPDSIYPALSTL